MSARTLNIGYIAFILMIVARLGFQQEILTEVVETSLGKIQGIIMKSQNGNNINAFRGIPYAQPPIGPLRFKAPLPALPWVDTFKANMDSLVCPQTGVQELMSEDCLTMNVFSRNLDGSAPVIVYIHGGANVLGSGNSNYEAGPQYLLDHDIVLVAFNYRLGALGFLSTQTEEAPGNYGYLGQVLALKWVRDYVSNFGGNPNLVTIFGLSAGSMAVSLHMASPLSQGLFHRAIGMSGSATNHFNIDNVAWTRRLAREVSCPMYNPRDVVDCLRDISWNDIVTVCSKWEPYGFTNMKWNYEIDNHFLHQHPSDSFLIGNISFVPILVGITKNELDFSLYHQESNTGLLNDISVNFDMYAPEMFLYDGTADTWNPKKSERIQNFYFKDQTNITSKNLEHLGEAFSDAILGHGVHRLVTSAKQYTKVYYYRMDYVGQRSLYMNAEGKPRGVGHADDLQYVMPGLWYGPQIQPDNPDMFMVNRMTSLWTSFARTGVPSANDVVEWKPMSEFEYNTLYINKDTSLGSPPYFERYNLWDNLFVFKVSSGNHIKLSMFAVVAIFILKFVI